MYHRIKLVGLIAVFFLASGCATGTIDRNYTFNPAKEAIFVIGVSADAPRVEISAGKVVGDNFELNTPAQPTFYSKPNEGYVVAKASVGTTQALVKVGNRFACKDSSLLTFHISEGGVYYITDVDFSANSGFAFSQNIGKAESYVAETYPKLGAKLQILPYQMKVRDVDCKRTIYISVPQG